MSHKRFAIWIGLIALPFLILGLAIRVQAQEPTPENDANCVTCHTHQYYLYDRGKWFCLCDAPMHCVYCHGGRTDSMIEATAHEGLVLYPTREQAERCQSCHPADYLERVVTFASVAGVSDTPIPIITATARKPLAALTTEQPPTLWFRLSRLEPWRLVALGLLGLAFFGVLYFGYRCWKADCLAKALNQGFPK